MCATKRYVNLHADRQVILGNHRDAWVFGAADPNSGTAVLMEMARTLSVLRRNSKTCGSSSVHSVTVYCARPQSTFCLVQH